MLRNRQKRFSRRRIFIQTNPSLQKHKHRLLLGVLGIALFLFLVDQWHQNRITELQEKRKASVGERQSILQEQPSLLSKAKNEVRTAILAHDDLKFPTDTSLLDEKQALLSPISFGGFASQASQNLLPHADSPGLLPSGFDDKPLEIKTEDRFNPGAAKSEGLYLTKIAAPAKTQRKISQTNMLQTLPQLILADDALRLSSYMRTFIGHGEDIISAYKQFADSPQENTLSDMPNITEALNAWGFPSLRGEMRLEPLRRVPLANADLETVTANANFASFREGLTLFSFEGEQTFYGRESYSYSNVYLLEILSLFAIGLIVWSALLYFAPYTSSSPLKTPMFAHRMASSSWHRLSDWQLAGRTRNSLQGIPLLRMTFHNVRLQRTKSGRKDKTVVWIHPEGIIQEKKTASPKPPAPE